MKCPHQWYYIVAYLTTEQIPDQHFLQNKVHHEINLGLIQILWKDSYRKCILTLVTDKSLHGYTTWQGLFFKPTSQCLEMGLSTLARVDILLLMCVLTRAGDISSTLPIRSVKNSVMSFCSPVLSGCLSMVYVLQNVLGLYAFLSLALK